MKTSVKAFFLLATLFVLVQHIDSHWIGGFGRPVVVGGIGVGGFGVGGFGGYGYGGYGYGGYGYGRGFYRPYPRPPPPPFFG